MVRIASKGVEGGEISEIGGNGGSGEDHPQQEAVWVGCKPQIKAIFLSFGEDLEWGTTQVGRSIFGATPTSSASPQFPRKLP